jgi:hypothetical protein
MMICAAPLLIGCGSNSKPYETAPVSGRITLDGAPLAGASVIFYPIQASTGSSAPEAYGKTDADGRYALATVFKDPGAVIGLNLVNVSTLELEASADPGLPGNVVTPERVPARYSAGEEALKFDVPAQGSQSADFDLSSK